jgi:hypothetical protein
MAEDRTHLSQTQAAPASPGAESAEAVSFTLHPEACQPDDAPTIISRLAAAATPASRQAWKQIVRGRKLGNFELEEPIGVGGMAAVIRGRDLTLDRPVALKILPPELATDTDLVARFEHESRAAARLDHENIARVYYSGQDKGLHFIAFEFVEGENLKARLERLGPVPIRDGIHIALQIASGLAHAAARGVVHRDIKPSNIIISESGRAKLVDMGLARSLDKRAEGGLTHSGVTLGTFDYISPEQALEPRNADVRSDLYSLGCTLYHLLTGVPPVPEGTAAKKLQSHQHDEPIDPRQLNPEVPDELAAILARLMAKDPNDRYQRPEHLVQHLLMLLNQQPGPVTTLGGGDVLYVDSILPRPPRVRPALMLAVAALAVIVLIAILGPQMDLDPPGSLIPASLQADRRDAPGAGTSSAASKPIVGGRGARDGTGAERPAVPASAPRQIRTTQDLQELAGEGLEVLAQLEDGVYDLTGTEDDPAGLRFVDSQIRLEARPGTRPVLRYAPARGDRAAPLFFLQGGKLVVSGIRIEIERPMGDRPFHAVALQGGHLAFHRCEVRWSGTAADEASEARQTLVRGLRPLTPALLPTRLEFRECILAGGGRAFDLEDCDQLLIERCALGPFRQPGYLRVREPGENRLGVVVQDTLMHLGAGPFLLADTRRPLDVEVTRSVFSRSAADDARPESAWLLLSRDQLERARLRGQDNAFHGVGTLVSRIMDDGTTEVAAARLPDLPKLPAESRDTGSTLLPESPWHDAEPLKKLAQGDMLGAFRLKTNLVALRRPAPTLILGPQHLAGEPLYPGVGWAGSDSSGSPGSPSSPAAPRPATREFVVDGVGGQPNTYRNLGAALNDADFDEEAEVLITLKWNGLLAIRPVELGSRTITIRAAPGFTPELTFNPDSDAGADGEAALFRIRDGSLTLDGLRVRLQPTLKETARLQSLVAVTGTGRCKLKNCLSTLYGSDDARMALVSVADPTGAMMGMGGKPPRPGVPGIELEDCVIRGQGDGVSVRVSRPFRLEVKNALIVLTGTLLSVEGNKREANQQTEGAVAVLDRVTAFVSQQLILMRATSNQPLHVPLRVSSATTCLFASAEDSPLLRVDGPDSEQELKRRLTWQGRQNFYSASGSILIWQPLTQGEMAHKYDRERWGQLWGNDDEQARFGRSIRFAGYPASAKGPAEVGPADFRIVSSDPFDPEVSTRGADLDRLPQPLTATPVGGLP